MALNHYARCCYRSRSTFSNNGIKASRFKNKTDNILTYLRQTTVEFTAQYQWRSHSQRAVFAAQAALREALETNWVKLEIHPRSKMYLLPDAIETLKAAEELLVKLGFIKVLPYITPTLFCVNVLEEVGHKL